jgi:curved DNA-binding protein CbpA
VSGAWDVLGLEAGSPWPEVRARWLTLVKELHPDHHGDPVAARRLAEVNAAYASLLRADPGVADTPDQRDRRAPPDRSPGRGGDDGAADPDGPDGGLSTAAFAVSEFRPVVFDALMLAAADVGDVTDADEPFSLDLFVEGPPTGFCHVELVPEAGGSLVTVDSEHVDAGDVSAILQDSLERMGLATLSVT